MAIGTRAYLLDFGRRSVFHHMNLSKVCLAIPWLPSDCVKSEKGKSHNVFYNPELEIIYHHLRQILSVTQTNPDSVLDMTTQRLNIRGRDH